MLLSCAKWQGSRDTTAILSRTLETIATIRKVCGYTFPLPVPVAVEEMETTMTQQKTRFWTKEPYEEKTPWLNYYLVFDRQLTEDELNLWRMFKMGRYSYRGLSKES
jgi:hypothetical protein